MEEKEKQWWKFKKTENGAINSQERNNLIRSHIKHTHICYFVVQQETNKSVSVIKWDLLQHFISPFFSLSYLFSSVFQRWWAIALAVYLEEQDITHLHSQDRHTHAHMPPTLQTDIQRKGICKCNWCDWMKEESVKTKWIKNKIKSEKLMHLEELSFREIQCWVYLPWLLLRQDISW